MQTTSLDELRSRHLVETSWLAQHLADPSVRVVDLRGYVRTETEPDGRQSAEYLGAYDEYAAGHIPGAIYIDWTRDIVDLMDSVPAQVAPPEKVAALFGAAGIGDDTLVVAYDNHPASQFATRLWWVLRYYGHDAVQVLNGGLKKWLAEGRPLASADAGPETSHGAPAVFTSVPHPELRVTAEQVLPQLHAHS